MGGHSNSASATNDPHIEKGMISLAVMLSWCPGCAYDRCIRILLMVDQRDGRDRNWNDVL